MQLQLSCQGSVGGAPLKITKTLTLAAASSILEIAYLLEDLPRDRPLHFAVEFNFAGLPAGADDRYFYAADRNRLGQLGARLDLADAVELGLVDEWLGIDVNLAFSKPAGLWTFPIESVSQSEGGFELVHQSSVVEPHWTVEADENGRWNVAIRLAIDTTLAESRQEEKQKAALLTHSH
jgi:alpha-amylase